MSDIEPRSEWTPPAPTAGAAPPVPQLAPPLGASAVASAAPAVAAPAPAAPPAPPAPPAPGAAFGPAAASVPPPAAPRPDRPRRFGPVAVGAALAVGALLGGAAGAGVSVVALGNGALVQQAGQPQTGAVSPQTITINDTDDVDVVSAVAAKAMPSVVTISVRSDTAGGTGSGVVIDDQGHIVTNTHVVTLDGAAADATITVTTSDGRVLPATVVGTDPIMDLAVIAVDPAAALPPIEFADSADLNVGDRTVAIGAPLGLSGTVTSGIVSALNRSITVASSAVPEEQSSTTPEHQSTDPFGPFTFDIPGQTAQPSATSTIQLAVIQTDTAINPGNSGGALLDDTGRLMGINVAIASSGSSASGDIGIGFAIPSNVVRRVADELIATGAATHGLLGASVADATADPAQVDAGIVGASIVELVSGGAAEKAGLQVGDIIVGLDGIPVTGKNDLTAQVRTHAAGAPATVAYIRDGQSGTAEVTLGAL